MLFKYTTEITAEKSLGEISGMLAEAGAQRISSEFREGLVVALEFTIDLEGAPMSFRLKADPEGVLAVMQKDRAPGKLLNAAQARRVAWRILREWVAVQVAVVRCQQATLAQLFLPYALSEVDENAPGYGLTLYEAYRDQRREHRQRALAAAPNQRGLLNAQGSK